jgi:hypothetical protein
MGFIADAIDGISSAFDSVVDIVEDIVDAVVDVVEEIGDFLFGWLIPDMPDLPDFEKMLQGDGILVNKRNSNDPLPVVYGTRRLGGNIVFLGTSSDNQFLYVVLSMCEGQVARFTELYIDDTLYATYTGSDSTFGTAQTISSLASASTSVPTNTSNLSIETDHPVYAQTEEEEGVETTHYLTNFAFFNGTDDGLNSTTLTGMSELNSLGWTSSHNGKGIAHAVFKFKYNSDAFNGIPKINFVIRGKLINTNLSGSSYAYSANPALILYDYLTSTRYGKGLSASDINTTAFTTAAGVCNTSVTPFSGASTEALFECHTALGNKTKLIDNVKKILSSMRSFFTFSGGLYTIKVEGTGSSVLFITEDMIIGGIKVQGENKQKKYNRVIARFDNSEKNFQPDEAIYPPSDETNVGADFKYATMLANDNNEELHFEMSMPCTVSPYQAEDMAELVLKRSRAGLQISLNATSEAQELIVGDIFQVTHSGMGFSASNFICMGITLQSNGTVGVKGLEYSADAYTYNTKLKTPNQPTTFLPDPKTVNAPVITSVTSEAVNVTEGNLNVIMTVTLRNTPDFFVDKYEVVYKKSTASIYKSAGISSSTVREIPVESGATYNVKARAINSLNYKSAFVAQDHFVIGFSDPPADVTNFAIDYQDQTAVLTWTPSADLDLAYYHIRFSPDTTHTYQSTTVLVEKVSPPANSVIVPAKAGIYYIKAFDLLGHESTNALAVIGTISEFQGQTLASTITEETAFSGTHSNTVAVDNILKLDSSGNFDSYSGNFDDATGLFDQGTGVVSSGTYTFANQISLGAKYQGRVSSFLNIDYLDYINNFDSMAGNFDDVAGLFDGAASTVDMDAKLLIATSDDNSTFTAFRPFQDGNYAFRYARFKIELTSNVSSATPQVNNCQVKLFMTDRTEKEQNIVSGAGTKAITFSNAFFAEPSVIIMAQNAAQNIQTAVTSKSATGFSVTFTNAGGAAQDVTFDYVATGQGRAI